MFRRFDPSSDVSTSTQVKASVQRSIKHQICTSHPLVSDDVLDLLIPKKPPSLVQYKVGPHLMLYCLTTKKKSNHDDDDDEGSDVNEPIFFQQRDGPVLPALKLVHRYPKLEFNRVTVDKGAIPFILGGANIMCPGLTKNPGVSSIMPLDDDGKPGLNKGDGIVVYAEGKEYPIAVGTMTMSTIDIRTKNKGIGIEVAHYLGDGLFQTDEV